MIVLVDTKKSSIVGTIELVGTHLITAEEYWKWHVYSKWEGMPLQVDDINVTFWAYDFINPRRLARPIKIEKNGKLWTTIDESITRAF